MNAVYALTAGAANKDKDVNSGTVAEIPAATISAKSDEIFKKIGEKLCGSIGEIVENKQSMIIDNINETIKKHLESDSVKDVISKKLEDILNNIPNKEELIKNVNERIEATVSSEIEKTLTNPATFSKLKKALETIAAKNPKVNGGTRKYRVKKNKTTKSKKNKKNK
jgi:transketolase